MFTHRHGHIRHMYVLTTWSHTCSHMSSQTYSNLPPKSPISASRLFPAISWRLHLGEPFPSSPSPSHLIPQIGFEWTHHSSCPIQITTFLGLDSCTRLQIFQPPSFSFCYFSQSDTLHCTFRRVGLILSPAFLNKHMEWGMSYGDVKDKIPEQGSTSAGRQRKNCISLEYVCQGSEVWHLSLSKVSVART